MSTSRDEFKLLYRAIDFRINQEIPVVFVSEAQKKCIKITIIIAVKS